MILHLSSLVAAQMGRSVGPPRLAVGGSVGVGTGRSVGPPRRAVRGRPGSGRVGRSARVFFP